MEVKTEVLSPPPAGKLGAVDKWRARLMCQGSSTGSPAVGWVKMIERRVAVLRVLYPFLTEPQLRGKAWKECGLTSIMGGLPRSGLSPKIKKEFTKRNYNYTRIGQRSRIKKEPKVEPCPFAFSSPKSLQSQVDDQSMDSLGDTGVQLLSGSAETLDLFQVSPIQVNVPLNDDFFSTPSPRKKSKKVHFADGIDEKLTESSYILPNTPTTYNTTATIPKLIFNEMNNMVFARTNLNRKINSQPISNDYPSTQDVSNEVSPDLNAENTSLFQNRLIQNLENPSETLITNFKDLEECLRFDQNKYSQTKCNKHLLNLQIQTTSNQKTDSVSQQVLCHNKRKQKNVFNLNPNVNIVQSDTGVKFEDGYPGETTPVQGIKIDVKNKIEFKTIAEVYHVHDDIVEKTQISDDILMNQSQFQSSIVPGYNGFSVLSSEVDEIENANEYFKRKDKNENLKICLTPVRYINRAQLNALKLCDLRFESQQMREEPTSEVDRTSISMTFGEKPSNKHKKPEIHCELKGNTNYELIYQNYKINHACRSPEYYSQNFIVSLPLTPADLSEYIQLPPNSLLSNYCSEHDRAYTKIDLRPVFHRNYYSDKIIKYLKDDFDAIIPPDQSLKEFFESSEISFKQVRAEVNAKVKSILSMLIREHT